MFQVRRMVCLVLFLVVTPVATSGQDSEGAFLRAGDVLRLTVWRNAEFTGEFAILADGSLAHPLLREVNAAGAPMAVVEQRIRAFLVRYETEPRFVIEPLFRIVVGGEVRAPGVYSLPPAATVAEAVGVAGGGTERARLESVRLRRDGAVHIVDLTNPDPSGLAHASVRSGDQLFVDRRVSIFREYIAPAGSITAALAAIVNILLR